jgi:hypothetical protein
MKKLLTLLAFILLAGLVQAQSFSYSYVNPCNGTIEKILIPAGANSVAVTYYNQVKVFSAADFQNGAFDAWASSVFTTYQNTSPCAGIGTTTVVNVTQSTAMTMISIMGSLTTISDALGSVNSLGAVTSVASSTPTTTSGGSSDDKNKSGSGGSGGSGSGSGSGDGGSGSGSGSGGSGSGSGAGGSGSGSGSGGSGSGSGSGGSGSGSGGSGGSSTSKDKSESGGEGSSGDQTTTSEDKKTDGLSGSNNAVKATPNNSSPSTNKNAIKPMVVAGSDLAGFNFKDGNVAFGGKINGNYTSVRYDQKRSHGVIFDYTTAIKGPNITMFYAWMKPKRITLFSNTLTLGFEGKGSVYNSIAFGQMLNVSKKLKIVYMASGSFGQVYKESFTGTALIAGGMYDWNVSKRFDLKLMALAVYAPYVSYYNDLLLKSPYVVLPSVGTNIKITKNFRFNINWGGAWALNQNVLNYTITMGTRLIL